MCFITYFHTDCDLKALTGCTLPPRDPDCENINALQYRTFDGTCNNLFNPLQGAAGTPSRRLLPTFYEDNIGRPVGTNQIEMGNFFSGPWPSPRYISQNLVRNVTQSPINVDLTHMFMQWGQFIDHDVDLHPEIDIACGCELTEVCIPINVHPDDSVFGVSSQNAGMCLTFRRTEPVCRCDGAREQFNVITAYIDASGIYGSSKDVADSLRLFRRGLLKQGGRSESTKGNLPFDEEREDDIPFFKAGDIRSNEHTGLAIMHTLWLREHNRLARVLADINPCWNDERLFQEARQIVGAEIQVITYNSFLPKIFGDSFETYLPAYRGYNTSVDATIPNAFLTAAYRFGHSLIRNQFERLDRDYNPLDIGPLTLVEAFFNPVNYFHSDGTDPIIRGLIVDRAETVDEFLSSTITSQLFAETMESLGMDLASLNIQRGRDHGLPPYRVWQDYCEDRFPGMIAQFRTSESERLFRRVYGAFGFHRGMDLWVSGLAEGPLMGGLVGPTFACIISNTFKQLRDGDRFWYENPGVFSTTQLNEIRKASLARVICDNADDIPEVPRDVFLRGSERVDCENIPEVNILAWFDNDCPN